MPFYIVVLVVALFSCKTTNSNHRTAHSKSPTTPNDLRKIDVTPSDDLTDYQKAVQRYQKPDASVYKLPPERSGNVLAPACQPLGDKSYLFTLRVAGPDYDFELRAFADKDCSSPILEIFQNGTAKEGKDTVELTAVTERFRYLQMRPDSFKDCLEMAHNTAKAEVWLGSKESCKLPPKTMTIHRDWKADHYQSSIELSALENFGLPKAAYEWNDSGWVAGPAEQKIIEAAICKDLSDFRISNGKCIYTKFVTAHPDSLIEFEEGTGLYPRVVKNGKAKLISVDKKTRIEVKYQFHCTVTVFEKEDLQAFNLATEFRITEDAEAPFVRTIAQTEKDEWKNIVIEGKGDLLFKENFSFGEDLSQMIVDPNCTLIAKAAPATF